MVKQPVNDVMAEKIYVKIAMVLFTLVGIAGGCMSIAGPVVGLTINPNELTATNFIQVERFGLSAALYFDCDKVDGAFGQKMVAMMQGTMMSDDNTTVNNDDSDARTSTTDTFESLCNDRKASHLYIAITSGVFTLVGMFVFIACAILKKFEPDFVYLVPLGLSFLMVYDFVETNSSMFAYIKTCTEIAVGETNKKDKLKNVILWGPYPNGTMGRYGVTDYGKACQFSLKDAEPEDKAELEAIMAKNGGQVLVLPEYPPSGPCRPDLANDIILCTKFYSCENADNSVACAEVDIKKGGDIPAINHDQEDRACNDLGGGLIIWVLGAIFNIIANGMMLSALVIRKGYAEYGEDSTEMQAKRVTAFGDK